MPGYDCLAQWFICSTVQRLNLGCCRSVGKPAEDALEREASVWMK